jgi:hypothetical protein
MHSRAPMARTARVQPVFAVLAVSLAMCAASADAQSISSAQALRQVLADLSRTVPIQGPTNAATPTDLQRVRAAIDWFNRNYERTDFDRVSEEYVRSLQRAAALLQRSPNEAILRDVMLDFEAKVAHCKQLGVGMGGTIRVDVNTLRATSVVAGWQVFYQLKFDEWLKTPPRNFLRVSSPAESSIEPGRYWIWARDPATGRTSDRILAEIAGRDRLSIDLPVP